MNFFVNSLQNNVNNENLPIENVSFKGIKNKGTVKEVSDEIFKIASAAITAAGVAALGIKAKNSADADSKKELVTKAELARRLDVNAHSIEWHLKEHLVMTDDNLIDLENPINKRFVQTFKKGTRFVETLFPPDRYHRLQKVLGKNLPLDYCLQYGLLTGDNNGVIDILEESNKEFIDKIRTGELTYKNFFRSVESYADYLGVHPISVTRALQNGSIVFNESKRIDINNPKNKAFEETVRKAQKRAQRRGLQRVTSFSNVTEESETLLSRAEFAKKLGYTNSSCLYLHIKNGRIVLEKNGCIDITREPNKSFMEAKLSGKMIKRTDWYSRMHKRNDADSKCMSRSKFAAKLGMSLSTLREHIRKGHVVVNVQDKIDITDERNKYFLENYKKGKCLYPNEKPVRTEKEPAEKPIKIINPNILPIKDIMVITGLTTWPLIKHAEKGRIIRDEDGVDITNPVNKKFFNLYEENGTEKLDMMSNAELEQLKVRMEYRYKNLIPRSVFLQAKGAKNKSEEDYKIFINNLTFSMFRVEILSEKELKFIQKMVKKIIDTRLNDKEKPENFSDIKEFKLSGIAELEYELNIIDKLMEKEKVGVIHESDIRKYFNENISKKFAKMTPDYEKFVKSEEYKKKLQKILEKLRKREEAEKIDFEKMTVEELQAKLFEFHQKEALKENTKLLHAIEFMFSFEINTDEEKAIMVSFVNALNDFINNPAEDKVFPAEILAKVHQLEENILNEEQKKQAKFEWVKGKLTDSIGYLYDKGMNYAADIVFRTIPKDINDDLTIRNAVYVVKLIDKLKEKPQLSKDDKEKLSKEDQEAKIKKLEQQRDIQIENILIGYDSVVSNSEYLQEAVNYSRSKYGVNKYKYVGEYIRHISNLEKCEFSDYPDFCEDVFLDLMSLDKREATEILIKLQNWKTFTTKEKSSFNEIFKMFNKKIPIEKDILNNYLEKYYVNFDTTIMAVGVQDKSLRIPAVLAKKAKNQMIKAIKKNELVDYFEEFESAMTRIIPPKRHNGIKPYTPDETTRTHEVTVSYPARLYCHKGAFFIFDEFVYDTHGGSNS